MLTDRACRAAKPQETAYKLADAGGLFLLVTTTGYRSWRWKYRFAGREKLLTFGAYPDVTLQQAREMRDAANRLRKQGIDPAEEKKRTADQHAEVQEQTFKKIALDWHTRQTPLWAAKHAATVKSSLEKDVFKLTSGAWSGQFGDLPIASISTRMVLEVLRPIEQRGAVDLAHRTRQRMSEIFVSAIAADLASNNPAASISKALMPNRIGRYPALLKLEDAQALLRAAEKEPAHPLTKLASRLLAVTAVRSESMRHAAPEEFEGLDTDEPIWRIPASKMKLLKNEKEDERFEFIVPLSTQAVEIVKAAKQLIGRGPLLFPTPRNAHRPMSENAISTMYRRLPGFNGRHVPHGWRSTFSTIMNERAVALDRPDDAAIIELMLAHKPQGVRSIYNRAAYMPRRRQLAQEWADLLLDGLPAAETLLWGKRG